VARAKRTTRAEARRRYRAEHGLPDDSYAAEDAEDDADATSATTRQARAQAGQPERMGVATAFRRAFRPLDLRGDLRALPQLAREKAFWLPVALTVASAVFVQVIQPKSAATGDVTTLISVFLFQYFVQPPAIGGVFIAGFLAPKASWLLGLLVGLLSAVCYAVLVLTNPASIGSAATPSEVILGGFAISPIMGALFASAAAWYRRFLQLSSPNRGRPRQGPPRRGNDGRSRSANQKAGARR
jgi:hypothetical protein